MKITIIKTIVLISVFSLFGCMAYHATYDISLMEAERPENAKQRYGEQKIVGFQEEGLTKYSFEDEMVKIVWLPTSSKLLFTLTNKTNHSIKIIWDEAAYVNENGISKRIMHSGVNYINRNNPQPPTIIPRNSTISDLVLPTDNVSWGDAYVGWYEIPLFPNKSMTSTDDLFMQTQKVIGKSVQVLLPLQIEDITNEYVFTFKINDVTIKQLTE